MRDPILQALEERQRAIAELSRSIVEMAERDLADSGRMSEALGRAQRAVIDAVEELAK